MAYASFTVTRAGTDPLTPVAVTVAVTAGDPDVDAPSTTVIHAGRHKSVSTVTVGATNDNVYEPQQNFTVRFRSSFGDVFQNGTVVDNEPVPHAVIADRAKPEGNQRDKPPFDFTVTLDRPSEVPLSLNWSTTPIAPTDANDYAVGSSAGRLLPCQ